MIHNKICFSRLQEGQFVLSKNLILIFLLMLINFHVLIECGHGECVPIVCWRGECNPNYYGISGCKDENENAKVKGVSFEYAGTGEKQFLPNYGTVTYTVKLGNNVKDGTTGNLEIYPPRSNIPGNPASDYLLYNDEKTSADNEIKFNVNLFKDTTNYLILGNLSNKLLIGGETFEFEGPYIAYNIDLYNVTIKPTEDGRYIDRITIRTRANEDMSFRLNLNKRGTKQVVAKFGRQLYYRLDKFHKDFTNLTWVPSQEGKPPIEYLDGKKSYDIDLNPI